ncbi:MAG: hypothetical protein WBH60_01880 [Fervidobacterium sp.]
MCLVFTSEVDDHGIDFVASLSGTGIYYEIQVKSVCTSSYVYISKEKMCHDPVNDPLPEKRLICVLNFVGSQEVGVYLILAPEWSRPNDLLRDRGYEGKKSDPEWGINLSKENQGILDKYAFDDVIMKLV